MTGSEIRKKFLQFFKERGHAIIPSASLVPENDPTVLFTTAGMHPLVPYLLGEPHPGGKRLASVQKCVRMQDIDEVGDNRHDTFFEMLGNWSLGDYFKKETIEWSFEFLTGKKWLGIPAEKIYVSVFAGDDDAPKDEESIRIWQELYGRAGIKATVADAKKPDIGSGARIYPYGKEKNWWGPAGETGPCGPDTEMFVDTGQRHDPSFGAACHPACDCGRFIEIWNDVFMEYRKTAQGKFEPLPQKNVDTGLGLERAAMILQKKEDIFSTDLFAPILDWIKKAAKNSDARAERIVADHVRTAVFMLADGVVPTNLDRGYILRRIIRRAVRYGRNLGFKSLELAGLVPVVIELYGDVYPELASQREKILNELKKEEKKFEQTLSRGLREFERLAESSSATEIISGKDAFNLFQSYGFPLEMTAELSRERGRGVDEKEFWKNFEEHQGKSRAAAGVFKGGLADHTAEVTRLHTATHLLHRALKNILGEHVTQKGSNITADRLRFDFSHPQKMTPDQIAEVEAMVNRVIQEDLPVRFEEMTPAEAKSTDAVGYFQDKYAQLGGNLKVYLVGNEQRGYFSKEICGGPHVTHTGELGSFKIVKEEAVAAGIRRIKAVVV
ncbi:alanine--tRNA ligase [Patescibacteria group bacterium]|nr:MAG: alanine--tRNA ligase [Patescibacteria group bacterium]